MTTVLIVCEHEDFGWMLEEIVSSFGYRVTRILSVKNAAELVANFAKGFDLIVFDSSPPWDHPILFEAAAQKHLEDEKSLLLISSKTSKEALISHSDYIMKDHHVVQNLESFLARLSTRPLKVS